MAERSLCIIYNINIIILSKNIKGKYNTELNKIYTKKFCFLFICLLIERKNFMSVENTISF